MTDRTAAAAARRIRRFAVDLPVRWGNALETGHSGAAAQGSTSDLRCLPAITGQSLPNSEFPES